LLRGETLLKDFLLCLTKVVTTFLLVVVCSLMFVAGVVYVVPATSAVLVEELSSSVELLPLLVSWAPAALAAVALEVAGMLAAARALRRASVKLSDILCERIEARFGESGDKSAKSGESGKIRHRWKRKRKNNTKQNKSNDKDGSSHE
jgi:hypothetical protein